MTVEQILTGLKQGNQRFIQRTPRQKIKKPSDLAGGQSPQTIILTCADSRVPPEMIFDQDLGDLFVIRVAGNTATDEAVGSIEYAAANLGSQLCIVLGHSNCGAVAAAKDCVENSKKLPTVCLEKVVEPILKPVKDSKTLPEAIELNVRKAMQDLQSKSPLLGKLKIAGAIYHLADGQVEFLT